MPIRRIHPYVETDDLDASRSFYTEVFGPRGFETPQPDFGIDMGDPASGVRRFFVEDPDGRIINVLAHLPDAT